MVYELAKRLDGAQARHDPTLLSLIKLSENSGRTVLGCEGSTTLPHGPGDSPNSAVGRARADQGLPQRVRRRGDLTVSLMPSPAVSPR